VAGSSALHGGNHALEALVDAAAGILAADSLQGTLARIAHHLAAVVAYDDLTLYEVGDSLVPVFSVGDQERADPITGQAVRERRTCAAGVVVAVPLLAHDRVVGALDVRRSRAPFSDKEVGIVERFATMAALAYDSARQQDMLRQEAKTDGLTGLLNHRGS
jgi:GAF domain-containing protein